MNRIIAGAVGAVLGLFCTAALAENNTVYLQTYGGSLGESFQKNVIDPFEKQTGINVVVSYGMGADALAKIRGQRRHPQLDVAMMGQTEGMTLWHEGLLSPLTAAAVPNIAGLNKLAVYSENNLTYYVGMYGYVLELVYRTDRIKDKIHSWKDLWNPAYAGEVMFSSPAILSAQPQVMVARTFGGDENNMEPGWQAMKKLAPNIGAIYSSDAETYNLIASGEAAIGPALMYTTYALQKAGIPVARVSPDEGSPISWDGVTLVKNGPNPAGGEKFINFMLSVPVMQAHVNTVGTIPASDKVKLSPELAAALPSTPEERKRLLRLDDSSIASHKADWIKRWDQEIVPLMH